MSTIEEVAEMSGLSIDKLQKASDLLNEHPWAESNEPSWMTLPTPVGGLMVELIPKTREILTVKWHEEEVDE